jgi:hypothetical protein
MVAFQQEDNEVEVLMLDALEEQLGVYMVDIENMAKMLLEQVTVEEWEQDIGKACELEVKLASHKVRMCIDSGAGINAVSRNFAEKMASGRVIRLSKKRMFSVATGSKGQVDMIVPGTLTIGDYSTKLFWVIVDNLPIDALLGYPVMRRLGVSIDPSNNSISFENIATVRANKILLVYERTDILTCRSITVEQGTVPVVIDKDKKMPDGEKYEHEEDTTKDHKKGNDISEEGNNTPRVFSKDGRN